MYPIPRVTFTEKLKPYTIESEIVKLSNLTIQDKNGEKYTLLSFSNIQDRFPDPEEQIEIMEKLYYGWAEPTDESSLKDLPFTPVCQEEYHILSNEGSKTYNLYPRSKKNTRESTAKVMNHVFGLSPANECFWIINRTNIPVG